MQGFITDPISPGGLIQREFLAPKPLPNEALVEVHAYSISRGELALLNKRPDGFRPGQELAGVVRMPAADGSGPLAGVRVAGLAHSGTWSQMAAVPGLSLGQVPDAVSMPQAVALAGSGLMAYRALRHVGDLEDKSVLIIGAAGAVGNIATQLALLWKADVTALVASPSRTGNLRPQHRLTFASKLGDQAGPFDVILDGVGGTMLPAAIRRLARNGKVLAYGELDGQPSMISPHDFRNAPGGTLQGFFLWQTDNDTFGLDIAVLCEMAADGLLSPQVGLVQDWSETASVIEKMRRGNISGKAVLLVHR